MTQPLSDGGRLPRTVASSSEWDRCTHEPGVCTDGPPNHVGMPFDRSGLSAPSALASKDGASWGLRFCRDADSVAEGYLCSEPVVVSDACRKPKHAFDAYVCDEPRMRELQKSVLRETFSIVKALLLAMIKGRL